MKKIWVDFQNESNKGVRLICKGTLDDLSNQKIVLRNGLKLIIWQDDEDDNCNPDSLVVEATVEYCEKEKCWIAVYDRKKLMHESERNRT